jgi:CTP:molybdopterin cytidylyltransferase MocA
MHPPAPIAIFVYKRAEHARRMLASLARNPLAAQSPITVYCDGPRSDEEAPAVAAARAVVRELAPAHARVVERERNQGLAASVIAGVSEQVAAHGAVIMLEDDLELSPVALDYLNAALERYRDEPRVMHVSAFMYPVRAALPETFFCREATCSGGWATWARAWRHFEPDGRRIRDAVLERGAREAFNVNAMDFLDMLDRQIAGRVDSWAIRWYGSLWLQGGLALHPGQSLVRNIGFDGSGAHSGVSGLWEVDVRTEPVTRFPDRIEEDPAAVKAMTAYRRRIQRHDLLQTWKERLRRWTRLGA